jgi:hypothetical protein
MEGWMYLRNVAWWGQFFENGDYRSHEDEFGDSRLFE